MMGLNEEVGMSALQLVCGLVELGEKYPNEDGHNVAGLMLSSNQELLNHVHSYSNSHNNYVSGLSFIILEKT